MMHVSLHEGSMDHSVQQPHGPHLAVLVRRCIEGLASPYLRELWCNTVAIQRRISLRSSAQAQLLVPVHGLLSDSAAPSLWLVRRLGMVFRLRCVWRQFPTPLYFSQALRVKNTLFDRGWLSWVDYLEGALYKTAVLIIIKIINDE